MKIKQKLYLKVLCVVSVIPRSLVNQINLRHHFHPRHYPEIFQGSGQKYSLKKLEKGPPQAKFSKIHYNINKNKIGRNKCAPQAKSFCIIAYISHNLRRKPALAVELLK